MATPGSVSRRDTAGVLSKGADPRTVQEKQKLCSWLRALLLPRGFCRCLMSCPLRVVVFSAVPGLCSFLLVSSRGRPPRNRALWKATPKFARGDGGPGYLHRWKRGDAYCILHCTILLSFLAFVHCRFRVLGFPPALRRNETILQLVFIRFPSSFGTSRHHFLFSTEPERSPSLSVTAWKRTPTLSTPSQSLEYRALTERAIGVH